MPAVKTKRISTLIESQLPEFISTEYELFSKFVQKYYEAQEVQGGALDILSNLQKYADIDYYEKNLLKQYDSLVDTISDTDDVITLSDASSFPEKNGYVLIEDEIIFYATRTNTHLLECSRGVSGNTKLGDLYSASNFVSTTAKQHVAGKKVYNVSNLFLYAFVKNFESQYLGSFPEKYLRGEVDKRTLIKNIQKFYKAKGTDSSIKFIFNTIVSNDVTNKPEVYNPRDFTYKVSKSDWINVYALKVKVISGNPKDLIGQKIIQEETLEYSYVSAIVDNVYEDGNADNEQIWNIVLAPETVTGNFAISTKTVLEKDLYQTDGVGKRINVFSTIGWDKTGEVLIGEETISFEEKNVTQFTIKKRGDITYNHLKGTSVYKPVIISGPNVVLLTLGVVYDFEIKNTNPYAYTNDEIQVSSPGFQTSDPRIVLTGTNTPRWFLSGDNPVNISSIPSLQSKLASVSTDVSAIFSDDQYYYIASSGFPSYKILDGSVVDQTVLDQNLLKIIRKSPTRTTEKYKTPKTDIGILLNGVRIYSHRDSESIRYGKLQSISVDTQGSGYQNPPFVLIDGVPNKARAILSGSVVERYIVDTNDTFPKVPTLEVTSGRGASVRAIVTGDKVTSLVIDNPGEYYSSPPTVRITDRNGKGRFAEYTSIVDVNGKITGFNKIEEGSFYNQNTVRVEIIPVGSGATAIPLLTEWNFNRFEKLKSNLDTEYGYVFKNYNHVLEYGYGHVANPKSLRYALNDNINITGLEPATKVHSPILGFAYDGNPIYGPFSYEDPLDPNSNIVRMTSSYTKNGSRSSGPSITKYPLGSFTNDYTYVHKSGSLDENNGRFCVTPDFPDGTYAYFITIDSNQIPQYPYFIGENFYSLPVDSNYNSNINQNDIPKKSKRFYIPGMPRNGEGVSAKISEVKSGTVDSISIINSSNNFSVNSKVYFNNEGSDGSGAEALVASVKGKNVNYLDSFENKVVKLTTIQNAYLFADDILRQPSSNASGTIVGEIKNDNVIVLKDVIGTFDNTGTFSADIKTFFILLDQKSSYTKGAILSLTDGINPAVATGEVLNGTSNQNTIEIKVLSGDWFEFNNPDVDYFLQSNNFFNTSGTRAVTLTSLSDNLEPFEVNQSVALIETTENHGLGIGDKVVVDIFPDDNIKTKTYYLRKRLYQNVVLRAPSFSTRIDDTGVGRFQILNGGYDYTPGTYTNVPLTGGSGENATATIIVSSSGVVSSIQIQNKGSNYKKADYLSVSDESLERSLASQSTSRLVLYVDHVGFASGSTKLTVNSTTGFAEGDLIQVGEEILEISTISGKNLIVIGGRENTLAVDHFHDQEITLYKARYNFSDNFQAGSTFGSGYIISYDFETQKATLVYDYSVGKESAQGLQVSSTFFDSSVPQRLVSVRSADPVDYKFEFSEDNINFVPNPNIEIQEFYRYVFDTSHSSLTGTFFDLSPSKNYNIITTEKLASTILPGNPGAYTEVKFGFGSRINSNLYDKKVGTDFTNFYYFDKNQIINSEGKYFKIISDPLQGEKVVNYVTPNRFVYDITSRPLWDGSGNISYISTGQFSVGEINSFKITNLGTDYKKVPIIQGVDPNSNFKAKATVLFDYGTNSIIGTEITDKGSNYSKPKVIITDGDGVDAQFNIVVRDGEIFSITVKNSGKGYTYPPTIEIIEGDVESYVDSKTIGIPQSISIIRNGGAFHLDKTVSSDFTSKYTVSLKSPEQTFGEYLNGIIPTIGVFQKGETVVQIIDDEEVFRAIVSEWRIGSNLLKLEKTSGILREKVALEGIISKARGIVETIFVSSFGENITSFFDNIGYYKSDRGRLGSSNQRLTDSHFYQDYSYVVKSKTPIEQWRDLIKSTTHPAGFKLFGQVDIEATAEAEMPTEMQKSDHFSIIQLWDPNKNKITVENTTRIITQTIQKIENQRIKKGVGSVASSEFNFNQSRAFTFTLSDEFDGYYDNNGIRQGTKTFQLIGENGIPFSPPSSKNLIITLDGILQDPDIAYTVSGDSITFAEAPLGPYQKLTGNNLSEVTTYPGVTFYGRYFAFNESQYNARYFKKIRNIFQRNGRWLDAANQIERNRKFIVEETIGYAVEKYPSLDWNTKRDDYEKDIGYIIDAIEHDIRFGGNIKTIDYTSLFNKSTNYSYITKNKTESLQIFKYASNLAKLAVRNWDIVENVTYISGSYRMTIPDTDKVAVGMYVSSGRAYPQGTRIVSIDSKTQITLSNAALANSGGGGGVPVGDSPYEGSSNGDITVPTSTLVVEPGNTFSVEPGDTVAVPSSFAGLGSATFYLSGINNGTFYDASNIINTNKQYITEVVVESVYASYPAIRSSTEEKCRRDIGYFIDAIVYHLRFGGNERVVEYSRLYYTNAGYPDGERLSNLGTATEIEATLYAWDLLGETMITAMRENENIDGTELNGVYFNAVSGVAIDSQVPYCAEVASAIISMTEIMKEIIENGTGAVNPVGINSNKSGNWSSTKTYSNYNIINDPLLPDSECDDVISSIDLLYENIDDTLNKVSTTRSLPDYVDGENKIFELYWEDGSEVTTEEDEDLFLTINAVLQRPKYNADYPGEDSYYIDRNTIPNKLVFDVAPIWDQDFGAKNIGEPTAVEKVIGIGVGNYKRLTIDYNLVDGIKSGPFLILDVEDKTVQSIEEKEYLYVFLDGVLQREGYSYEISGPNIYFNVPIKSEMKIDMRYLYGRDVGQILNLYDFSPNEYYAYGNLTIGTSISILNNLLNYSWMGNYLGLPVQCLQQKLDGSYNIIGEIVGSYRSTPGSVDLSLKSQNGNVIDGLDIIFCPKGFYDVRFVIPSANIVNIDISYSTDEYGRKILESPSKTWAGTSIGKSYKNPFISLSNGDTIRVEGEDKFRKIKILPTTVTSKDNRDNQQLTNNIFGSVSIEDYAGITRGEGLSVIANIEDGKVVSLSWNQRSYSPITQPTAYQYFTPPVLEFIPEDGNGGGASATVVVSKGQVVSVDLIDGGYGYTTPPKVVVSRRYDILSDRDIGVSVVNIGFQRNIDLSGISYSSVIDLYLEGQGILYTFSETVRMPGEEIANLLDRRVITSEVQIVRDFNNNPEVKKQITIIPPTSVDSVALPTAKRGVENVSKIQLQQSVIISDSLVSDIRNKEYIVTINTFVANAPLSNVNQYEVGAYLEIDADPTDTIIYIPDTTKFSTNGLLLIGNEVVRYLRKLKDRFLMVERGEKGTTPQFWPAGTFIRQIPDLVSVAFTGVASISSQTIVSLQTSEVTQLETTHQLGGTNESIVTLKDPTRNSEALIIHPGSGIYDRYVENIYVPDPVITRFGFVDLISTNEVITRNSGTLAIRNILFGSDDILVGNYEPINAGPNIGNLDAISWDVGESFVSGVTIEEYDLYYSSLTIADFIERKLSSYTISKDYVNLVNPSIQNPVQRTSASGSTVIGSSLNVLNTTGFPSSGYLYHSDGTEYGVIYYGSKTSNSFGDCVIYSGNNAISSNSDIIPYTGNTEQFITPLHSEPVLDLNFAQLKSLNNQVTNSNPITFSRNSIGTYIDENGIIQTAQANEARFTHDLNGKCLGLLVEEQRTNLFKYSSMSNSTGWDELNPTHTTFTYNQSSPDGLNNAVLVTATNTSVATTYHGFTAKNLINLDYSSIHGHYTISFYAKSNGYNWVGMKSSLGGDVSYSTALYNLETGEKHISYLAASTGYYDISAEEIGDGWYRIKVNMFVSDDYTLNSGNTYFVFYENYTQHPTSWISDGVSGAYFWEAQLEEGYNATSHIPTNGSTITRLRDSVNILGANFSLLGFDGEKGTFYLEHEALEGTNNDSTYQNTILYNVGADGNLGTFYNTKSDTQDIFVFGDEYGSSIKIEQIQSIDRNKVVFSYDAPAASYGAYIDGVAQTNVTTTNPYQVSTYNQFNIAPFVGKPFSGTIGRLIYWNNKFDNNDLDLISYYLQETSSTSFIEYETTSDTSSITIRSTGSVNYQVDWGDGLIESLTINTASHNYSVEGKYRIKITPSQGTVYRPHFNNNSSSIQKVLGVGGSQLGTNLQSAWSAQNRVTELDAIDTSNVTNFYGAWQNCYDLKSFPLLDFSSATDIRYAWQNCRSLREFPSITLPSSVTNLESCWNSCHNLMSFPVLNTSNILSFSRSWQYCRNLTSFPLLDSSNVTNFTYAWQNCSNLTSFPLLDTSSANNFQDAWNGCIALTSFPLLDSSGVTNFRASWQSCRNLTSFPLLDSSNVINFYGAWGGCHNLTSFPLIDTSNGTDFRYAWQGNKSLTSFPALNFSSATDFGFSWSGCTTLTTFPANMFNTTGILIPQAFSSAFGSCALTAQSIENILVSLDTNGQSNITLSLNGGTSAKYSTWTTAAQTALANLQAKGWTITYNT